jgi:hypothetical protein
MNAKIQFIKGLDEKPDIRLTRSRWKLEQQHFDLRIQYL